MNSLEDATNILSRSLQAAHNNPEAERSGEAEQRKVRYHKCSSRSWNVTVGSRTEPASDPGSERVEVFITDNIRSFGTCHISEQ